MTNRTNSSTNLNHQEENTMQKFIVEAPVPKDGQEASSGGIRENGKIVAQFRNPVPCEGPTLPPAVKQPTYTRTNNLKDQAKDFAIDCSKDIIGMLWFEFGRPFIKAIIRNMSQKSVAAIKAQSQNKADSESPAPEIIDVEAEEISYVDEKIIRFPSKKAI